MDRKLLPYEHQLIDALGITKEEYLAFVAVQQEYADNKVGTALDIRNDAATAAIVLTVVGILFQVGAALLAPKPKIPDLEQKSQKRSREARFAPTFGFNSAQELASYGDPVNLVYTNTNKNGGNPNGGVRLGGSLVWSSIESYGSAQFMQLLFVMGASRILEVKPEFTAFGQVALQDFDPGLAWMFYAKEGPAKLNSLESGTLSYLPERIKQGSKTDEVCRILQLRRSPNRAVGFSQSYTPTTSTAFGPYDPIPVDIRQISRDEADGGLIDVPNGVKFDGQKSTNWFGSGENFTKNQQITLRFLKAKDSYDLDSDDDSEKAEAVAEQQVDNLKRQYIESMNFGSTYMFGTAKFIIVSASNNRDISKADVTFTLECIEGGREPFTDPKNDELTDKQNPNVPSLKEYKKVLKELTRVDTPGTGEAGTQIKIKGLGVDIDFSQFDGQGVKWIDIFGNKRYGNYNARGSLQTSIDRLNNKTVVNPPVLDTDALKRFLRKQAQGLRQTIIDIRSGVYDDPADLPAGANNKAQIIANDVQSATSGSQDAKLKQYRKELRQFRRNLLKFDKAGNEEAVAIVEQQIIDWERKIQERERKLIDKVHDKFVKQIRLHNYDINKGEPVGDIAWLNTLSISIDSNGEYEVIDFDERTTITVPGVGQKRDNTYVAGLEALKESLQNNKIFNELLVDQRGVEAFEKTWRPLIDLKKQAIKDLTKVKDNYEKLIIKYGFSGLNRGFFSKCLVKTETASYETVLPCDNVRFSVKARLFRRISGRQREYGEDRVMDDYSAGDNGVRDRVAFFRVKYKEVGEATYNEFPMLFAIRRGSESDAYLGLYFEAKNGKTLENRVRWQFKFESIHDPMSYWEETDITKIGYITGEGTDVTAKHNGNNMSFYGEQISGLDKNGFLKGMSTQGPANTFEYDMFSNTTDTQIQFSFEQGPEFSLTAVSEQQLTGADNAEGAKYNKLSTMALIIRAGKGVQDLRNVTTFVTQGKRCYNADTFQRYSPEQSSSYAPDIFVDTVLDTTNGVGNYIARGSHVLDKDSIVLAKNFCKNNGLPLQNQSGNIQLFMDGVIADQTSWREFWANTAPLSLLELVRKNGKEALVPAIPVNSDGKAAKSDGRPVPVTISALFTPGNIIEGSYKEEFVEYGQSTQPLIATVIYREMETATDESGRSVFSRQNTVEVLRKNDGISEDEKSREVFDASSFVTQREQAIMIGKLLVNQRMFTLRGTEFKTFPTNNPVEPGSYVYIDVGNESWDKYSAGKVMSGGALSAPLHDVVSNGTYSFLLYNHGSQETTSISSVSVSGMRASSLASYEGWMFVMGTSKPSKRVFRITEVALDEEGEVTVKAMEYPCNDDLSAKIADFRSSKFTVR